MEQSNTNKQVHFVEVAGTSHFSDLAPTNALIAKKIVGDTGAKSAISLTGSEASGNIAR